MFGMMMGKKFKAGNGWWLAKTSHGVAFCHVSNRLTEYTTIQSEVVFVFETKTTPKGIAATRWTDDPFCALENGAPQAEALAVANAEMHSVTIKALAALASLQKKLEAGEFPTYHDFSMALVRAVEIPSWKAYYTAPHPIFSKTTDELWEAVKHAKEYAVAHFRKQKWAGKTLDDLKKAAEEMATMEGNAPPVEYHLRLATEAAFAVPGAAEYKSRLMALKAAYEAYKTNLRKVTLPKFEWHPPKELVANLTAKLRAYSNAYVAFTESPNPKECIFTTASPKAGEFPEGNWEAFFEGGDNAEEDGIAFCHSLNTSGGVRYRWHWKTENPVLASYEKAKAEHAAAVEAYHAALNKAKTEGAANLRKAGFTEAELALLWL